MTKVKYGISSEVRFIGTLSFVIGFGGIFLSLLGMGIGFGG